MLLDYLTLLIALWGALLSTILAIRDAQKDKPHLNLICTYKTWSDLHFAKTSTILVIRAVNHGDKPVTIEEGGLLLSGGHRLIMDSTGALPKRLETGDAISFSMDLDSTKAALSDASANGYWLEAGYVRDVSGKLYTHSLPEGTLREFQNRPIFIKRLLVWAQARIPSSRAKRDHP